VTGDKTLFAQEKISFTPLKKILLVLKNQKKQVVMVF
jgi:hypothetical protein